MSSRLEFTDASFDHVSVWDKGLEEYAGVGDSELGTLFYTWFKGVGTK